MAWSVNARTSAMMDEAQALYGATITVLQGSPSTSDPSSAGTHAGEGVIDVDGADLDAIVIAMRQVGFAAWHRTPAQGFPHHVHGVAVGEPLLSPQAATQVEAYFAGRNGLRDNAPDDGPRDWVGITWETYQGGTYTPGVTAGPTLRMWNQYPGDRCGAYLDTSGGVLAGPISTSPATSFITFNRADLDTPNETVTLTVGDSIMLAALEDFRYGEPDATVTTGYWLVRYTGGGTLTVADAYDLGYDYPTVTPTWVDRAPLGANTDGVDYYAFDPAMLDGSHLYNDGQPLIRVTCTAGTAVLNFVGLQVQTGSGFWLPDGEQEWSPSVGPQTQLLAAPGFDGTYDVTTGAALTDDTWTVDGSPVYQFEPLTGGMDASHDDSTRGKIAGTGNSLTDVDAAIAARDSDLHPVSGGIDGVSEWRLEYDDGLDLFPVPENWTSRADEVPQFWTAPTKSELPTAPPGIPPVSWNRSGTFEWFGDDTGILGWVVGPTDQPGADRHVLIEGDAQTVTLYVQTFSEFVNTASYNPHTGTILGSWMKTTDDDLYLGSSATPLEGELAATDLTTSDTLLILSTDSTIRTENGFRHTYPSGGTSDLEGFTGSLVSFVNIPVAPRFRIPGYRYEQPSFIQETFIPVIDFDEDLPVVRYLRNRQRNDGLGGWSTPRAKGTSSRQLSLHNRGYE